MLQDKGMESPNNAKSIAYSQLKMEYLPQKLPSAEGSCLIQIYEPPKDSPHPVTHEQEQTKPQLLCLKSGEPTSKTPPGIA